MPFITQNADDLGGQRFVQEFDYRFAIRRVPFSDCAVLDVLARTFAQSFDISEKWFIGHDLTPSTENLGGHDIRPDSIRGQFALHFDLSWGVCICRHLNRNLPDKRFDTAGAGVVLAAVEKSDLRLKIRRTGADDV
jgi:hypothetical protein